MTEQEQRKRQTARSAAIAAEAIEQADAQAWRNVFAMYQGTETPQGAYYAAQVALLEAELDAMTEAATRIREQQQVLRLQQALTVAGDSQPLLRWLCTGQPAMTPAEAVEFIREHTAIATPAENAPVEQVAYAKSGEPCWLWRTDWLDYVQLTADYDAAVARDKGDGVDPDDYALTTSVQYYDGDNPTPQVANLTFYPHELTPTKA